MIQLVTSRQRDALDRLACLGDLATPLPVEFALQAYQAERAELVLIRQIGMVKKRYSVYRRIRIRRKQNYLEEKKDDLCAAYTFRVAIPYIQAEFKIAFTDEEADICYARLLDACERYAELTREKQLVLTEVVQPRADALRDELCLQRSKAYFEDQLFWDMFK